MWWYKSSNLIRQLHILIFLSKKSNTRTCLKFRPLRGAKMVLLHHLIHQLLEPHGTENPRRTYYLVSWSYLNYIWSIFQCNLQRFCLVTKWEICGFFWTIKIDKIANFRDKSICDGFWDHRKIHRLHISTSNISALENHNFCIILQIWPSYLLLGLLNVLVINVPPLGKWMESVVFKRFRRHVFGVC